MKTWFELLKGETIFELIVWNFCGFNHQRDHRFIRNERGIMETKISESDQIIISQWNIHSIGKKLMRLEKPVSGKLKKTAISKGYFEHYSELGRPLFFQTKEEAIEAAKKYFSNDPVASDKLEIFFGFPDQFQFAKLIQTIRKES